MGFLGDIRGVGNRRGDDIQNVGGVMAGSRTVRGCSGPSRGHGSSQASSQSGDDRYLLEHKRRRCEGSGPGINEDTGLRGGV